MPRITRIAGSFAIVTIVYWAYALLAVPWIEPPADLHASGAIPDNFSGDLGDLGLVGLFSPGSWELKGPKVLESDRAKLLFQRYENRDDGTVELLPCTIVFDYDGPAEDEAQLRRQSIILESPAGAVLQFDQKLNLNRMKVGRLLGGKLNGKVTIRSDWKEPGPQDDLRIVTSNIQLTEKTVFTKQTVDFRWGPHFGRGQQMLIKLLAGPPKPNASASGPNISGIESFELQKIERLHLDLGQTVASPAPNATSAGVPVEINCRGPFRFDAIGRTATFSDQVDVMVLNPSGPSDQLACELLTLYFTDRVKEKTAATTKPTVPKPAGSLDLTPERIEALGKPVVVTAPSHKVKAHGERLEYNMLLNAITLDGGQEVVLQRGPSEIHARSLYYKSAGEGRLGQVAAQGPGWLRGQSDDRPNQQLEAIWTDQLRVEPNQQKQCISLTGGAELKFQGAGQLQAKEIFFWLLESPPAPKGQSSDLHPHSMLARHDVHMNSPELTSTVDQLELWFEEAARGEGTAVRDQTAAGSPAPGSAEQGPASSLPIAMGTQSPSSSPPLHRFEVVGRLLQARILLLPDQEASVSNLTIEDGVRFTEIQATQPGEPPLIVRGDRLVAVDPTSLGASVTVVGRPARLEGRGLGLTGSNINLDRGANRLSIDGPGQMDLPMKAGVSLQGQTPAATGGRMTVDWQHRMEFNGQTARFEQSVVATAPQQQLRTEMMRVHLQWPISFSQPNTEKPPEVEKIECQGGVILENRSADPASYDQIHVTDLAVNVLNGELNAGPGWLNRVFRGAVTMPGSPAGAMTPSPDQLNCLYVQFQKSVHGNVGRLQKEVRGNVDRRQFEFTDEVQMSYAPVNNWDAILATNDPNKLGPKGVVVNCDALSVVEMGVPMGDRRAIEIVASGNTVVEGNTFTATGNRISYAEAKDLLILEGDGRNNAKLYRQLEPGGARSESTARKILYKPGTNWLQIDGMQSLSGNITR